MKNFKSNYIMDLETYKEFASGFISTSMRAICYRLVILIYGIFCILSKGELGEAYNVVNPLNTMKIRDMAYLVANSIADGSISVTYDIQNNNANGYAVSTGLRLSAEKLMKLGWKPKKDLIEMYREVINELRQ